MLRVQGSIPLPPHSPSEFDHGDVHRASGRVVAAHTKAGTVDVLDGDTRRHLTTIAGCAEASDVLVAQEAGLVFAAARATGQVLVIARETSHVLRTIAVDPRPNGLAWDGQRQHLLVADVQANTARLITPAGETRAVTVLPGRPRWCAYDAARDRFLVNIREPACVAILPGATGGPLGTRPVASAGPHGVELEPTGGRGSVASARRGVC